MVGFCRVKPWFHSKNASDGERSTLDVGCQRQKVVFEKYSKYTPKKVGKHPTQTNKLFPYILQDQTCALLPSPTWRQQLSHATLPCGSRWVYSSDMDLKMDLLLFFR